MKEHVPGDFQVLIKVRSEDTGDAMAVLEETVPARQLVPPHTHQNDVWVYVLSGQVGVLVGGQIELAGPGAWALKPRNIVHAMWNPGPRARPSYRGLNSGWDRALVRRDFAPR